LQFFQNFLTFLKVPIIYIWFLKKHFCQQKIGCASVRPFSVLRPFISTALLRPLYFDLLWNPDFLLVEKYRPKYSFGRSNLLVEVKSLGRSTAKVEDMKMVEVQKRSKIWKRYRKWSNWCVPKNSVSLAYLPYSVTRIFFGNRIRIRHIPYFLKHCLLATNYNYN